MSEVYVEFGTCASCREKGRLVTSGTRLCETCHLQFLENTRAPSANETQVGGDHYRKVPGEQHWDRQWRLFGRGYFIGNATAYIERYVDKNGVQDLEKAMHYIQKLKELEEAATAGTGPPPGGGTPLSGGKPCKARVPESARVSPDTLPE